MKQLLLIDHLLAKAGTHHEMYDALFLREAAKQGYSPLLAAQKHYQPSREFADECPIYCVYEPEVTRAHHHFYKCHRASIRARASAFFGRSSQPQAIASPLRRGWEALYQWNSQRKFRRASATFVANTLQLVEQVQLQPDDHVFLSCTQVSDLPGVCQFLREHPQARQWHWRLLFHTLFYHGRGAIAADTQAAYRAHQWLTELSELLPSGALQLFANTEPLADQFNQLCPIEVKPLPWLVCPRIVESERLVERKLPLRLTCLGTRPREKGVAQVPGVVDQLWDLFVQRRLQLHLIVNRSWTAPPLLQKRFEMLGALPSQPIVIQRHPLEMADYLRVLRESDIALLLYDPEMFYDRCSGILVEMLSAGTPVVVSAGSWLAGQIEEAIQQHRETRELNMLSPLGDAVFRWEDTVHRDSSAGPRTVGKSDAGLVGQVGCPRGATHVLVSFLLRCESHAGGCVSLQMDRGGEGNWRRSWREINSPRANGRRVYVLMPLECSAQNLRLTWSMAFGDETMVVEDVRVQFGEAEANGPIPLGAVGLVAADDVQVSKLVREIVHNFAHYRRSAADFSLQWGIEHHPQSVVPKLLDRVQPAPLTECA